MSRRRKQSDLSAAAPPPQFSGGGKWEAMHGTMTGWHEIRLTGPGREQFRLFCLLENAKDEELLKRGLAKPAIAIITGMRKPWRTTLSDRDYKYVRQLGKEHRSNHPRRIATQLMAHPLSPVERELRPVKWSGGHRVCGYQAAERGHHRPDEVRAEVDRLGPRLWVATATVRGARLVPRRRRPPVAR